MSSSSANILDNRLLFLFGNYLGLRGELMGTGEGWQKKTGFKPLPSLLKEMAYISGCAKQILLNSNWQFTKLSANKSLTFNC